MKLPRDVDARQLIKALAVSGCSPLKAGTLNAILAEVATHHRLDKSDLIRRLFG